jgi:(p)ppGpp synthase/HD superfamily hydrolase
MLHAPSSEAARGRGYAPLVERALRVAATYHHPQSRKGGAVPYITHPVGMALLLQRFGFDDDELIAAALLHDVVEDTACTLEELAAQFPPRIVDTVAALSERKHDEDGLRRPWRDRKLEHIAHIKSAPLAVRVVALADKLHNLLSIRFDLDAGEDVWGRFNALRPDVEWYHRTMIDAACQEDSRLVPLADACREVLDTLP